MVFQQKVQEKEQKLKQSEEELYARHREMKEALEKQRLELEDKKRRVESGRPLTPEKGSVSTVPISDDHQITKSRRNASGSANERLHTTLSITLVSGYPASKCAYLRGIPNLGTITPRFPLDRDCFDLSYLITLSCEFIWTMQYSCLTLTRSIYPSFVLRSLLHCTPRQA